MYNEVISYASSRNNGLSALPYMGHIMSSGAGYNNDKQCELLQLMHARSASYCCSWLGGIGCVLNTVIFSSFALLMQLHL